MSNASSYDQTLEQAARDGSIDIAEWPRVLESVLQKLHQIVHNEFPTPRMPPKPLAPTIDPEVVASTPPQLPTSDAEPHDAELDLPDASDSDPPPNSQHSTKENDTPVITAATRPPVPKFDSSRTSQPSDTQNRSDATSDSWPPDVIRSYEFSVHTLEHTFARSPPYTVQRLAELVLRPHKHYRYLPSFIRALDRIVSVTSPVSEFPLPVGSASVNGGFLVNGDTTQVNGIQERDGLGSDESLGGALLTPIPWLRNNTSLSAQTSSHQSDGEFHSERMDTILGPNGAGSVETVTVTVNGVPSASSASHTSPNTSTPASPTLSEQSDASTNSSGSMSTEAQLREQGGVTQGELLRQEQEAGVIPVAQAVPRRSLASGSSLGVGRGIGEGSAMAQHEYADDLPDEMPHARGPEKIGMEDTGIVQHAEGLNMDAAVGRGRSKSPQPPSRHPHDLKDEQDVEKEVEKLKDALDESKEAAVKDGDGDVAVHDAGSQ